MMYEVFNKTYKSFSVDYVDIMCKNLAHSGDIFVFYKCCSVSTIFVFIREGFIKYFNNSYFFKIFSFRCGSF